MLIRLVMLIVSCLFLQPGKAQFNKMKCFDVSSGMAMTECTTIFCDQSGRIWTIHNNGFITMFDGLKFTSFSPQISGLFSASVYFKEDRSGVWIISSKKSISLYAGEKWTTWREPEFFITEIDKETNQLIGVAPAGDLYHYNINSNTWVIHAKLPPLPPQSEYRLNASLDENKYILQHVKYNLFPSTIAVFESSSLMEPKWKKIQDLSRVEFFWSDGAISATFSTDQIHELNYFSPHIPFPPKESQTYTRVVSDKGRLFLYQSTPLAAANTREVILYLSEDLKKFKQVARFYYPHRELGIVMDKTGNVWISSQGGLCSIDPSVIQCHEGMPYMVASFHTFNEDDKGRIWFGGYNDGLCYFDGINIYPAPSDATSFKRFLPGRYRDAKGNMAFFTEDYNMVNYENGIWHGKPVNDYNPNNSTGYYFLDVDSQFVAGGLQNYKLGITTKPLTHKSEWRIIGKEKGMLLENVLTVSADKRGRLWAGRWNQGICLYDPAVDSAHTWLIGQSTDMHFGVMSTAKDLKDNLWLGCNDGLRLMRDPHTIELTEINISNRTKKLSTDEAGYTQVNFLKEIYPYLVFGNLDGYGFLDLKGFYSNPNEPRIFFYPTHGDGGSSEQNAIMTDTKGYLWIGHDEGATRIDLSTFTFDTLPIHIIIDSLLAGSEKIALDSSRGTNNLITAEKLPVLKRYIEIFLRPSFTGYLADNVGFKYRLLHDKIEDTTWSEYGKIRHISFSYLPPGENTIQIRAIKNNQIADETFIELHVPLTLSESPAFWIGSVGTLSLIGCLIGFLIYRQRLQLKQTQIDLSEQRREKEQFQIRAIANSLNPHFIKNSLNWAQTRFRTDHKVATVIDELSSNISTIFKRSREGQAFHSLADEFELVRNYISIQQATYGHYIDISLPSAEIIEHYKNIVVPLMQIQIHVENAIEHGIRNRTGAHILIIEITERLHYLDLTITDDGIGRKGAVKLGSHGTQQGTLMLESLHKIYNHYNEFKFSCHYEDLPLTDPVTGEKTGTRIHIIIPKQYNFLIHENNQVFHS